MNAFEHRLCVRHRAADGLKHFGGRGLMRGRGTLCLVEQARVLDGDHGLVGEGLQQLDLVGCERSSLTCALR